METMRRPARDEDRTALAALRSRQQAAWAAGDYGVVGTTLSPVGERLCDAAIVRGGERVLDVACGNGNTAVAAARRSADVVAVDYVHALVAESARRAAAERLSVDCRLGDAERLEFAPGTFDAVLSVFGVMFVADPERAAAELVRVCRPGGRIGLANWTPDGFVGRMFDVVARHVPPSGAPSPFDWARREHLERWFDGHAIASRRCTFVFRYRSAEHWLDVFARCYGPLTAALERLGPRADVLRSDLVALAHAWDLHEGRGLALPADYLETVVWLR